MTALYPSWIEIPVSDLDRALAFYRAVFQLSDTPIYDEPPARIAVLLASEKSVRSPGVSLVQSPTHTPSAGGVQVNFHLGTHANLSAALDQVRAYGGQVDTELVDDGDGQHYITFLDCEGNRLAISSYEPLE
jgi:predicted enzyme related to lactoylglutathione lyase